MQNTLMMIGIGFISIVCLIMIVLIYNMNTRLHEMTKTITFQYNMIAKLQQTLKNKSATNIVAEHAEMIYQDLLQNIIPIMAAIDVMPRNSSEHPLWRALGGIMDEYAKNPFVLEKLRRSIKLDPEITRRVDNYMNRADTFLHHLTTMDPNGIMVTTFTDGLLGQSLTFFTQAKQLAVQE